MIATTHVGSLPRGPELVPLLLARDKGEAYDGAEFDRLVQRRGRRGGAAAGRQRRQCGQRRRARQGRLLDVRDRAPERLRRHSPRKPALDLAAVPELAKKLSHIMGSQEFTRASAIAKVELVNLEPLHDDIRRFKTALDTHGNGVAAFMNSASPGLITAFQPNQFYPSHEAYLADLVDAMRPEYEAIVAAGLPAPARLPDLAMSRTPATRT
jgi:5-methyltetrahydropteroyltriglutamate--homocysteine methyltransferase